MSDKFTEFLTPSNCAMALVDHQTGLLVGVRDLEPNLVKTNIQGLCHTAKVLKLPTVITASVPSGPNGPVMPEILEILPDSPMVYREGEINAWDSEAFRKEIEKTGKKKIILAGLVTDVCLLFPSISMVKEGYDIYAIIDASGTWNKVVQEAAMHRMTQAGVKVCTWASVLAELMNDWRSEKGMELGSILAAHTSYQWTMASYMATRKK